MGPQLVRCGMPSSACCRFRSCVLQWGRNLFVAECTGRLKSVQDIVELQWGRNLFVAECRVPDERRGANAHGFNGAATCSLRNAAASAAERIGSISFNGAATCSLRNGGVYCGFQKHERLEASMGPQLVRCGMPPWPESWRIRYMASMGPQLVRCGMHDIRLGATAQAQLQWGRNLFVAECTISEWLQTLDGELQWGRNLFVAECR